MRTYNYLIKKNGGIEEFIESLNIHDSGNMLVRIHSAIHTIDEVNSLIETIRKHLPSANFVGCSTGHVILDGQVFADSCLVSISEFDSAGIFTNRISCVDGDGNPMEGEELAKSLLVQIPENDPDGYMLIFFPISYGRIEAVINAINESGRSTKMLGGTAYLLEETEKNKPFVIAGTEATAHDMAYAYISGDKLSIYCDYACGVESVGKKSPISANGTIIETVDGIPGGQWYANLLGKEALDKNPEMSESFPLVMQTGREISYHVEYKQVPGSDEYFIQTFPELRTGSSISPGYFHPQKIFDQVSELVENVSNSPCESIFIYDCSARSVLLSNCAKWELGNFIGTNNSGCLLSGEITYRNGSNFYANLSFVISSLSEDPEARFVIDKPDVSAVQTLQEENVQALHFLLANSTKYLNEELDQQRKMLSEAVFYNPAVGIDNQLKFQFDHNNQGLNKVAIFYLNNEKMLRLFSGVSETYGFLTDCYQKLNTRFATSGISMYSYQDTSLIIAAGDGLREAEFETLVDNVQEFLNGMVYEDIRLSYIAITIFDSEDPLTQLEIALDHAKNHNLNRIHYNEIMDSLEKEQENFRMLWIIRDSIQHGRVLPYFQEIHSNVPGKRRIFEALMRLTDEEGKLIFPDVFLPISKEFNLYDRLSELMVEKVMDMFRDKDCRVTINLSVKDIYNRNILKMIFDKMKSFPKPENYVFEIVESEEVHDYEYIKSFADRIHEYGGKIAIDDFGSGFSNMLNIMRIDADYIKMDGEVVKQLVSDSMCRDFVEFMQSWCEKNEQALICEYVENQEIQDIMEGLGVAYSQGYHFSKPHPWGPEDE